MSARLFSVAEIQKAAAEVFGVPVADILSDRRDRPIFLARAAAIYFARTLTDRTWSDIARRFNRDHTTVPQAMRAFNIWCEQDERYRQKAEALRHRLTSLDRPTIAAPVDWSKAPGHWSWLGPEISAELRREAEAPL